MSSDVDPRVFVAGHSGMVGAALVRRLRAAGRQRIVTASRAQLDLTDRRAVDGFFCGSGVEEVYLAAAKVGGIHANTAYPADFICQNLAIQTNVIAAAHEAGVQKLLFLGSSCIYPRLAPQPIPENALLGGHLEASNEPYAIAKIAGIKLCESYNRQHGRDYRCVMPTNLYGPGDNFHAEDSHVVPALLRRFHEAVRDRATGVPVWGSGMARREFLHVDDMADACIHVMALSRPELDRHTTGSVSHLNIGTGRDCTIRELAESIARVVGFHGELTFDASRPDGTPRKLLDVTKLSRLGWQARIQLEDGLRHTYGWYLEQQDGGTWRR